MKWYRFFKSSDDGKTVTVPSAVPTFVVEGNFQVGGTSTQTGVQTFSAAPVVNAPIALVGTQGVAGPTGASPLSYKVMTLGGDGATPISVWTLYGEPSAVGPTPAEAGDILIDTKNGKIYIASAATAYTDFKLVTSA
jgi:hypothetical protein